MTRRLLVVDAPGGPHPAHYLPSILREFEVAVVWLAVEPPAGLERRRAAFGGASLTREVRVPGALADVLREVIATFRPHGLVAFSERIVHIAQRVAGENGMNANSPESLRALQDKRIQRSRLAEAGLDIPLLTVLSTEQDCSNAAARFRFPAVMKPSIGMGSIATFRVEHAADLLPLWHHAKRLVSSDDRIAHQAPVLLLEEELQGAEPVGYRGLGDYVSVEALSHGGNTVVLAVSDKLPLATPFRENAHLLPSIRSQEDLEPIVDCALRAHDALGITYGITHTEIKLTAEGPRIIEVNGRVGGGVTEELLLAADYDLPLQFARASTGLRADIAPSFHRYATFLTPQPPEGRHLLRRAPDKDRLLAAFPQLESVTYVAEAGQTVDSTTGTASNLVKAMAAATNHQELVDLGRDIVGPAFFELEALNNDPAENGLGA